MAPMDGAELPNHTSNRGSKPAGSPVSNNYPTAGTRRPPGKVHALPAKGQTPGHRLTVLTLQVRIEHRLRRE